ncbi:scarecrow-like protein 3 [Miscanthus floridulus]|uniref:scarecrow-like protein 3 n=1 Tax=Miscanthus floridulus TaxID=154761 RepID=UPI0034584A24
MGEACVLSVDGGRRCASAPGGRAGLTDFFDAVAGSGVGGVLAALLFAWEVERPRSPTAAYTRAGALAHGLPVSTRPARINPHHQAHKLRASLASRTKAPHRRSHRPRCTISPPCRSTHPPAALCLIHLLLNCATAAGAGRLDVTNVALEHNVDATQWLELLHLLVARPEGPLHLLLTAVHEHRDVLTQTAMALTKEVERLDVPFQFNPVVSQLEALDAESLCVKTGEALAVTSSVQLHCLLASDDDSSSKDSCLHHHQSSNGKGGDTNKRHERLDRWVARMEGAGFARVPLSYYALLQARRAAQGLVCDGFKVREEKVTFFLCWQDRVIFSVSAWRDRCFN